MSVEMVRITFDHSAGPPGTRALHIRTDGATAAPPDTAAYALAPTMGQQLTVEAELRFPDLGGEGLAPGAAVSVRAQTTAASSTVLGKVKARDVVVPAAGQTGTFVFELSAPKLQSKGIGIYTVAWEWQFRLLGTSAWVPFHTSEATIYITLDVPTAPWTQATDAASQRLWPWTRLLRLACDWAGGVKITSSTPAGVKTLGKRVEKAIHGFGDSAKFDYGAEGEGRYVVGTSAGVFNITTFVEDLESPAEGLGIYCTECAAAVAIAANCLGGDLSLLRLDRPAASLHLNSHMLIGATDSREGNFTFHDVAVRISGTNKQVFDATLKPDWDVDVSDKVHDFKLTQGKKLGELEVKPAGKDYLQRLLEGDVESQWEDLAMLPVLMPCLDQCAAGAPAPDPTTDLQFMRRQQEIKKVVPAVPLVFLQPPQIRAPAIDGFRLVKRVEAPARLAALAPLVSSSAEFWYVSTANPPVGGRRGVQQKAAAHHFKIAVAWSPTPAAAQEAMAWLMVRNNVPLPAFPPKKAKIGDAAHGSRGGAVVYMVRGNVLVHVSNIGKKLPPTEIIAQKVDQLIQADWSNQPPIRGRQGPSVRDRRSSST